MYNKITTHQKGQALPLTLFIVGTLTVTVGIVGYSIMNERTALKSDKVRTDVTYAAESAQQYGEVTINDFLSDNLANYVNSITSTGIGATSGTVLGDETQRNALFNNLTETNEKNFMIGTKLSRPIKFKTRFYLDSNKNGAKDSGEESFKWIDFSNAQEPGSSKIIQTNRYSYVMVSEGYTNEGSGKRIKKQIINRGILSFKLGPDTFAKFSLFTNTHLSETDGILWFTDRTNFKGPVHTNGGGGSLLNFSGNPGSTFSGKVTTTQTKVRWYNNNSNITQDLGTTTSSPKNGTKDVPNFVKGLTTGAAAIPMPTNSISQARAALGGDPNDTSTTLSNSERRTLLGLSTSTSAVPNGIYVPKNGTESKGGIYIQGDVDSITMDTVTNTTNSSIKDQRYLIVQGSTRKLITMDRVNNKTIIQNADSNGNALSGASNTETLTGTLRGSIHVEGDIDFLGGPQRNPSNSQDPATAAPAIAKDNMLTISGTKDIIVQRDIKYEKDPRGADGVFNTSDDDLDVKNMLGLFTSGGDVRVGSNMPYNGTLHATVMASDSVTKGVFKVDGYDSGSQRGNFNLLGGVITDRYGAFGTFNSSTGVASTGYGRNFDYDIRTEKKLLSPPYFPTISKLTFDNNSIIDKNDWNERTVND